MPDRIVPPDDVDAKVSRFLSQLDALRQSLETGQSGREARPAHGQDAAAVSRTIAADASAIAAELEQLRLSRVTENARRESEAVRQHAGNSPHLGISAAERIGNPSAGKRAENPASKGAPYRNIDVLLMDNERGGGDAGLAVDGVDDDTPFRSLARYSSGSHNRKMRVFVWLAVSLTLLGILTVLVRTGHSAPL